ncbi:putative CAP domain-containing protein [Seiridium unicorne]|uniref:CAP domain-containing protein n=1 Tax=Seiridium unicorne TaxID=138068 RepID=A0ABR2UYR4_9PEZI
MTQQFRRACRLIQFILFSLFLIPSSICVHGATINAPAIAERRAHEVASRYSLTYDQWNALNIHNGWRRGRNLRPLVWDSVLQQDAQNWANHLAYIDRMVHSNQRGSEGENLAWISGGGNPLTISTNMWMAESKSYWGQIIPSGNFEGYGHYTQAMWRSTSRVGMASARARSGRIYTVARYWNAGNIVGQRPY